MAYVIKNSFTGGVVDESLSAKIDLVQYDQSCRELNNFILRPQGGIYRRPGLRFIAEPALDGTPSAVDVEPTLIPFVYNIESSYIVALLDSIYKVYVDQAYLDEGISSFTEEQNKEVDYAQSADVLYLTNRDNAPFKIIRLSTVEFEDTFLAFATNYPTPSGLAAVFSGTTGTTEIEYAITALTDDGQESLAAFISVANGQSPLAWSSNSQCDLSWAEPGTQFGANTIRSVTSCCPVPQVLAVGDAGIGAYTSNLVSWTLVGNMQFATTIIRSAAYSVSASVLIAVGDAGKGSRSVDFGVTWTAVANMQFGTTNILDVSVSSTTSTMVAVGFNGQGSRSVDNGVTWTPFTTAPGSFAELHVVRNSPSTNRWLAGTRTAGRMFRSDDDGVTWVLADNLGTSDIYALAYSTSLSRWVAGGFKFSNSGTYYSDDDGSNWTEQIVAEFPQSGSRVMRGMAYHTTADLFVSVWSSGQIFYSQDGLSWTEVDDSTFGSDSIWSITYCPAFGVLIAGGANGKTAFSFDGKFWSAGDVPDSHNIYKKANGIYGFIGNARGEYTFTDYNYDPVTTDSIPEAYNPFAVDNPGSIALFQQRLWFANTSNKSQTIFASRIADFENLNFSPFIRPDDSIENTIVSSRPDGIQWLIPFNKVIKVGTIERVWTLSSASGGAITPTDINIEPVLDWGAAKVRPVLAGNSLIYVEYKGTKIFDLFERQEYLGDTGNDLSVRAPELFEGYAIVSMAYQRTPDPIVWCVRNDGKAVALTYLKNEGVWGWHIHETDGLFKNVVVIPGETYDEVYFTVLRNNKYLIELLEQKWNGDELLADAKYLDSMITQTSGTPFTVVTGLDHLEGKSVYALADGAVQGPFTVSSGQITLTTAASVAQVGLNYTSTISPLSVEYATQDQGVSLGKIKSISNITLRVQDTVGGKIGPRIDYLDEIETEDYDRATAYTGDVAVVSPNAYNKDGSFYVVQDEPFPFTLNALFMHIEMGDR